MISEGIPWFAGEDRFSCKRSEIDPSSVAESRTLTTYWGMVLLYGVPV